MKREDTVRQTELLMRSGVRGEGRRTGAHGRTGLRNRSPCSDPCHTAANGATMPNSTEKEVRFRAAEGLRCMPNMQVADAKPPLGSVSRIGVVGPRVLVTSQGGYLQHETAWQTTSLYRDNNVYMMTAEAMGPRTAGSTWQGERELFEPPSL